MIVPLLVWAGIVINVGRPMRVINVIFAMMLWAPRLAVLLMLSDLFLGFVKILG